MPRILNKEFIVIVTLTLLVLSGVIIHSPNSNGIGRITRTPPKGKPELDSLSNGGSVPSVMYLTRNLSVPAGSTYTLRNQHVILQSLSRTSIGISVAGTLNLVNSAITISNASYSRVRKLYVNASTGSTVEMANSTIETPGTMDFNGSNISITDSILSNGNAVSNSSVGNALTIQVNDSTMRSVNSTITGLYRQNSSHEYRDGGLYLYESGFSLSKTVPTKVSSYRDNGSYINAVEVNATYQGASNESVDSLEVYYNNSYLTSLMLPYNSSESSRQENFTVNLTGSLHNLSWMDNTSNFRLVANISYATSISLSNVTVGLMSNDTVALYGQNYYSYPVSNSTVLFYNSSLGLNENARTFDTGEPNFKKLSMQAQNSAIFMGDTSITGSGHYESPFISLANSSLYLFREISVNTSYMGIQYSGANLTLLPSSYGRTEVQNNSFALFSKEINHTGVKWLYGPKWMPALYETTHNAATWNYTDEFTLSALPGTISFSVGPFPYLTGKPYAVDYRLPVPYADFTTPHTLQNFSGNITLDYSGDLAGLASLDLNWTLYRGNTFSGHGVYRVENASQYSRISLPLGSLANISYGNYTLAMQILSPSLHVFSNSTNLPVSFSVPAPSRPPPVHRIHIYTIREEGISNGTVWGIGINGTDYFSDNTSISIANASNENITVIVPQGLQASSPMFQLSLNETNYTVIFSKVLYRLSFTNNLPASGLQWGVTVNGHNYTTANNTLELNLLPGTYNYVVYDPHGYTTSNTSGIVNLSSGPRSISLVSQRQVSLESTLAERLSSPYYYIPLLAMAITSIAYLLRRRYHTWYICEKCGATKKSKRAECPSCNLPDDPAETIFWDEDWD